MLRQAAGTRKLIASSFLGRVFAPNITSFETTSLLIMFGASWRGLVTVWALVLYLIMSTASLQSSAAPVPSPPQHGAVVTSPPDRLASSRDHQSSDSSPPDHASSDNSPPDHLPTDQHSQNQQSQNQQSQNQHSDSHKEDDCHFKNTEIALPITFSLEMPSYVMIAGHRFHIKLQMPVVNHGK